MTFFHNHRLDIGILDLSYIWCLLRIGHWQPIFSLWKDDETTKDGMRSRTYAFGPLMIMIDEVQK